MPNHVPMAKTFALASRLTVFVLLVTACGSGSTTEVGETTTHQPGTTTIRVSPSTSSAGQDPMTTALDTDFQPDFAAVEGADLAYECLGSGSPTVVFEHGNPPPGFEAYDPDWGGARETIEAIARFTEACIYGRRGVMGSDPVDAESRTAAEQVADLEVFIDAIDAEAGVVLVGYSWGGALVRLFAGEHPETVAGLVLVDSAHPDADDAYERTPPPPEPPELIDFASSQDQIRQVTDLGDLPIRILVAGEPFPEAPDEVHDVWFDLQEDLMSLSTRTQIVRLEGVTHSEIPASARSIAEAVRLVISDGTSDDS